jgi:hypothetical protein
MNLSKVTSLRAFPKINISAKMVFGIIIFTALIAFEMFNYSTTDFALRDLLGELRFASIRWATILSIAFCGIDFAGIARLFTPQQGTDEPKEVWYLFGAWLLAATMNAMLTWWGVSIAVANHNLQSTTVIDPITAIKIVPIFVAIMVWVIRILIIGTISVAGDHLLWGESAARKPGTSPNRQSNSKTGPKTGRRTGSPGTSSGTIAPRPSISRTVRGSTSVGRNRTEPTYHSMSMSQRGNRS